MIDRVGTKFAFTNSIFPAFYEIFRPENEMDIAGMPFDIRLSCEVSLTFFY